MSFFYFPGFPDFDCGWIFKYREGGHASDWHSPLMSYMAWVLDRIGFRNETFFLLHAGMFSYGMAQFARLLVNDDRHRIAYFTFILFYFPLTLAVSCTGKDAAFVGAMVFSSSALMVAEQKKSKLNLLFCFVGLVYGFSVRHNAIFATLPFVFCFEAAILRFFPALPHKTKIPFYGFLALVGLWVSAWLIKYPILKANLSYPSQVVMIHDLAAVSSQSQQNYFPELFFDDAITPTLEFLETSYTPSDISPLVWGLPLIQGQREPRGPHLSLVTQQAEYLQLKHQWIHGILAWPQIYLKHRARVFGALLGWSRYPETRENYWPYRIILKEFRTKYRPDFFFPATQIKEIVKLSKDWWIFKNGFYLLLLIFEFLIGWKLGLMKNRSFVALSLSAFCYISSFFFFAPGMVFRYFWWPVAVSLILPAFILGRIKRRLLNF